MASRSSRRRRSKALDTGAEAVQDKPPMQRILLVLLLALPALGARGGAGAFFSTNRLAPEPFLPALVATAAREQIALSPIAASLPREHLQEGDRLSAVVTMHEPKARPTQWLLALVVEPAKTNKAGTSTNPVVWYSSFGTKLVVNTVRTPVRVRTFGPFSAPRAADKRKATQPQDKLARFDLDEGFLGLGLHHTAAALYAMKGVDAHAKIGIGQTPFSDAAIEATRKSVAAVHFTPEQDRALLGSVPALMSYVSVIQQSPGLSDILWKIVDAPSLWSVLWHGGVRGFDLAYLREETGLADPKMWSLPAAPFYRLPLQVKINHQPALKVTMLVTAPHPPLLPCAGVVGLLAEKPDERDTYLTVRIVSASGP